MRMPCRVWLLAALLALSVAGAGCHSGWSSDAPGGGSLPPLKFRNESCRGCDMNSSGQLPSELHKTAQPSYVVEPPDQLLIDVIRAIPRPPYRLEPLDALLVVAPEALPKEPLGGIYPIEINGLLNLGLNYGSVRVAGLTVEEAKAAIEDRLKALGLANPQAIVSLAQMRGLQQIRGEHLVEQDGVVSLGVYGRVSVMGLTIPEVRAALERHLSQFLMNPEVSVDVIGFNTKTYYVIFDGGGYGQQINELPITGNDTVLRAIGKLGGLPPTSSTHHIWVARPSRPGADCDQILPVDWCAITQRAATATNYQLFPGDRVFVEADELVATNNWINKVVTPIERLLGVTLLTNTVIHSFQTTSSGGGTTTTP